VLVTYPMMPEGCRDGRHEAACGRCRDRGPIAVRWDDFLVLVLEDADVQRMLKPAAAIAAVRESLIAHHTGGLIAPPRLHAPLGDGDLVFTAGRLAGTGYGFRVYRMTSSASGDQLTVVYDDTTGELTGVITGDLLGAARTGAIGAVAADVLARPDAGTVGLIGSGYQAWTQLWAIRAVRPLRAVRVHSRDQARREAFARRAAAELGVPAVGVEAPAAAVDGADIVVLATTSRQPVIEAGWVAAGAHVSTLGPKAARAHECPPELADRAEVILTDSPAQIDAFAEPFFLTAAARQRLGDLGAAAAGAGQRRQTSDQITLFCSVGLAGTEVAVAAGLLRAGR
jgi:ornithine cyclodeaminase/alanine dehydrogenase-like protein (mu-crystallin family)